MPELSIEKNRSMKSYFIPHIEINLTSAFMDLGFSHGNCDGEFYVSTRQGY